MKRATTLLVFLSFGYAITSFANDGAINKKKEIAPFSAPVINYTDITSDCSTGDRTLIDVQITCVPGIPTTGSLAPRIYYRKSASGTWVSKSGTLTSGNASNGYWNFPIVVADMGGLSSGDVVQYYVIAQSTDAAPAITSKPAGVVAADVNTVTTAPSAPSTCPFFCTNTVSISAISHSKKVY